MNQYLCDKILHGRVLIKIDSLQIPRFVHTTSLALVQIHGFCDASIRAYGCCLYLRSCYSANIYSNLLTAKSKVAPLKTKSLPRLELYAKLWNRIKKIISFEIETFVSNRVAEIQEWSDNVSWHHFPWM